MKYGVLVSFNQIHLSVIPVDRRYMSIHCLRHGDVIGPSAFIQSPWALGLWPLISRKNLGNHMILAKPMNFLYCTSHGCNVASVASLAPCLYPYHFDEVLNRGYWVIELPTYVVYLLYPIGHVGKRGFRARTYTNVHPTRKVWQYPGPLP